MDNDTKYRQSIEKASVISFDVFDTLIHRIVLKPVDVFELLVRRLGATDIGLHHPAIVANFARLRREAEIQAREQHNSSHGSHEITLNDIYRLLKETFNIDDKIIDQIMAEEFLLEQAVVYADPLMKSLYEYALQQNKIVILCSDMYLSSEQITLLLDKAGYKPPFRLFVSGELKQSKHEGSMYLSACEQLGIHPSQILHFGDNKHADYEMPQALGIPALLFDAFSPEVQLKLDLPPENQPPNFGMFSLIQGSIQRVLLSHNATEDPWFEIGVKIFGPLFLGKFLWFMSNLRQEPVDKVLFFARDAHFFHQLYEQYKCALGIETPAEYVYLSRAVLLVPSFTEFVTERVWHLFSGRSMRTVKEHLKRLDINSCLVRQEIKEAGFKSDEEMVAYSDTHMHQLLTRLYPLVMETAKQRRETVVEYIHQVTKDSRRIAMVDIGWTGNMQGGLSRLLQLRRNDFDIFGYYFGTFNSVVLNYLPRNQYRSYLVRESQPWNHTDSLQSGGVELLEFALMAPHGTTLGYEQREGRIHPILEQSEVDTEAQALAARVQHGAMKFVEAIMPLILHVGPEHLFSAEWAEPFFRLVNNPTIEEAQLLGRLTHSDSASDTSRRLPLAQKLDAEIARKRGEEYRQAHADAFWKKAFELLNA